MAVVMAEGFATPFDPNGEAYPAFGNRVPALRGFYLGYDVGIANPSDPEIVLIQVLVGGESEDLSPNAANQPARVPDGRIEVAMQDANAEGEEFFYNSPYAVRFEDF